jgi:hypothetical protein
MEVLIGIIGLLVWVISDVFLGIKIKRTGNIVYKVLLIVINIVFVIIAALVLS